MTKRNFQTSAFSALLASAALGSVGDRVPLVEPYLRICPQVLAQKAERLENVRGFAALPSAPVMRINQAGEGQGKLEGASYRFKFASLPEPLWIRTHGSPYRFDHRPWIDFSIELDRDPASIPDEVRELANAAGDVLFRMPYSELAVQVRSQFAEARLRPGAVLLVPKLGQNESVPRLFELVEFVASEEKIAAVVYPGGAIRRYPIDSLFLWNGIDYPGSVRALELFRSNGFSGEVLKIPEGFLDENDRFSGGLHFIATAIPSSSSWFPALSMSKMQQLLETAPVVFSFQDVTRMNTIVNPTSVLARYLRRQVDPIRFSKPFALLSLTAGPYDVETVKQLLAEIESESYSRFTKRSLELAGRFRIEGVWAEVSSFVLKQRQALISVETMQRDQRDEPFMMLTIAGQSIPRNAYIQARIQQNLDALRAEAANVSAILEYLIRTSPGAAEGAKQLLLNFCGVPPNPTSAFHLHSLLPEHFHGPESTSPAPVAAPPRIAPAR